MSFSSTVKDELVGIKTQSREERLSILCGLTHTAAAVTLGRGGLGIIQKLPLLVRHIRN